MPDTPATPASAAPAVTATPSTSPAATSAATAAAPSTPAAAPASPTEAKTEAAAAPSTPKADAKAPEPFKRETSILDEEDTTATAPKEEKKTDAPAAEGVPEKYDFKVPEGVTLDPERMAPFEQMARELGLSNDRAQKLLDQHIAEIKRHSDGLYNQWNETQKSWKNEIVNDKEIGGPNLKDSKASIGRFINSLPEAARAPFREALNFTGAGNNPAVFRALVYAGQRMKEGTPVSGKPAPQAAPKTAASVLYPSHSKG